MPVTVTALSSRFRPQRRRVARIANAIFRAARVPRAGCDVYLAGGAVMRRLGRRIQSHRGAWNVLAFPAPAEAPQPDRQTRSLGEVYIDPLIAIREARRKALPGYAIRAVGRAGPDAAALAYYLAHGILHLLGYDHVRNRDTIAMEREEARIMNRLLAARVR